MKIERAHSAAPTPEELAHLDQLRALVTQSLADGKLSKQEMQSIDALINADHLVTATELRIVRETIRQVLGDAALEYEWQ